MAEGALFLGEQVLVRRVVLIDQELVREVEADAAERVGLTRRLRNVDAAVTAALVYLVAHACYKGALFLVAGAIDHETGTRDLQRLSGLSRFMPITATVACVTAAAMAGVA